MPHRSRRCSRNKAPNAFGSTIAARWRTTGDVNAPRSAEVGSPSARPVATVAEGLAYDGAQALGGLQFPARLDAAQDLEDFESYVDPGDRALA